MGNVKCCTERSANDTPRTARTPRTPQSNSCIHRCQQQCAPASRAERAPSLHHETYGEDHEKDHRRETYEKQQHRKHHYYHHQVLEEKPHGHKTTKHSTPQESCPAAEDREVVDQEAKQEPNGSLVQNSEELTQQRECNRNPEDATPKSRSDKDSTTLEKVVSVQYKETIHMELKESLRKYRDSYYAMVPENHAPHVVNAIQKWQEADLPHEQLVEILDQWDPDGNLHSRIDPSLVEANGHVQDANVVATTTVTVHEKVVLHVYLKRHHHPNHNSNENEALDSSHLKEAATLSKEEKRSELY